MPLFQGVIFQTCGDAGWSNVFYLSYADAATAMTNLQNLNTQLLGVQAATVFTQALRVSDVTIKGDGLVAQPTTDNGSLSIVAPDTLAPLNLAQRLLSITTDNLHRVSHYIHGMRASDITTGPDGRTITTPTYRGLVAMTNLQLAIKNNTVNWQKRSLPPVTATFGNTNIESLMSVRKVGRPFGQFRGRRRIA